jgi:integrase
VSVERRVNQSGEVVWRVRWRERNRNPAKVLGRKSDAIAFDAEIRRLARTGELGLVDGGRERLDEFAAEWMRAYGKPNLAPRTVAYYASAWDLHISPRIGGLRLREVSVEVCQRFAAELAAAGIGRATRRKLLMVLGSVLQRAVEWGRIPSNPVRVIRKPTAKRERTVRPWTPAVVEAMRARLLGHERTMGATLVCVLAYAGLRPSEALALRWGDMRERTLLVERALGADGVVKPTKTGHVRSVRLLAPLTAWRAIGASTELVFPSSRGDAWSEHDWRNWRRRVFVPAAKAVGLPGARPYDLRHSAASLWLHEGRMIVGVATWMGHSGQMALSTYLHVMSDLGDERVPAEEAIRRARAALVPSSYPSGGPSPTMRLPRSPDLALRRGSRRGDSNPRPHHYE